ncbi:MAG: PIN domain-containing protein [Nitrospirota bacterium]
MDANILFSAAYRRDAELRNLWKLSKVNLVTSLYAVEEARRNLDTEEQIKDLDAFLQNIEVASAAPEDRPIALARKLPDKDRPILLAAIAARATHLLTGDYKHFGPLYGKAIEGVLILPPAEFFRLF